MSTALFVEDSEFVRAMFDATEFRRHLVKQLGRPQNSGDELSDSRASLSNFANICFWASVTPEEGRPVRGTVCVCAPDEAPNSRALKSPLPLTTKNLVAMLRASPNSPIAVHMSECAPAIWGFIDAEPMFALRVRIASAGTLVASAGRQVRAIFQNGTSRAPENRSEDMLLGLIVDVLGKTLPHLERLKRAKHFLRIVATMLRHGNGGILVFGPSSEVDWQSNAKFQYKFDGKGSGELREKLDAAAAAWAEASEVEKAFLYGQVVPASLLTPLKLRAPAARAEVADSMLRRIGDLSSIDGALVMDEDLNVIGFGAKLTSAQTDFKITTLDILTGESVSAIPLADLGGTRHQSTARFVHESGNAAGFVASQDGRLTLFATAGAPKGERELCVVKSLEHLIWDYQ